MPTPYRIETARVVLRPWALDEAPAVRDLVEANLDHLRAWMPWAQAPPSVDEQLATLRAFRSAYDRDEDYIMGVFLDGAPIGGTGLHPRVGPDAFEIGYWIDRAHEGRGLVTEWVAALCRVAFEAMDTERIDIHCDPVNLRSAAVPQRLGFVEEAVLRRRAMGVDGRLRDDRVFTLLASEGAHTPVASAVVRAYDALGRSIL